MARPAYPSEFDHLTSMADVQLTIVAFHDAYLDEIGCDRVVLVHGIAHIPGNASIDGACSDYQLSAHSGRIDSEVYRCRRPATQLCRTIDACHQSTQRRAAGHGQDSTYVR